MSFIYIIYIISIFYIKPKYFYCVLVYCCASPTICIIEFSSTIHSIWNSVVSNGLLLDAAAPVSNWLRMNAFQSTKMINIRKSGIQSKEECGFAYYSSASWPFSSLKPIISNSIPIPHKRDGSSRITKLWYPSVATMGTVGIFWEASRSTRSENDPLSTLDLWKTTSNSSFVVTRRGMMIGTSILISLETSP